MPTPWQQYSSLKPCSLKYIFEKLLIHTTDLTFHTELKCNTEEGLHTQSVCFFKTFMTLFDTLLLSSYQPSCETFPVGNEQICF